MLKSFRHRGQPYQVEIQKQNTGFFTGLSEDGKTDTSLAVSAFEIIGKDRFRGRAPSGEFTGTFLFADNKFYIHLDGSGHTHVIEEADAADLAGAGSGIHKSPMPGKVIAVNVNEGDVVEIDATLLIVEAMKMENAVKSGVAGTVKSVRCKAGDLVKPEDILVEVEEND